MQRLEALSPFRTRAAQIRFILFILFFLSWPWVEPAFVSREKIFNGMDNPNFSFPTYTREIYQQKEPLDLVFIGPCTAWWQVFPKEVAASFVQSGLKTPTSVVLGYNHFGMDLTLMLFSDLLKNRHVKNLVLPLPRKSDSGVFPHPDSFNWWIYKNDRQLVKALGFLPSFQIFSMNVLGSYRRLSTIFRSADTKPNQLANSDELGTFIRPAQKEGLLKFDLHMKDFSKKLPIAAGDWQDPIQTQILKEIVRLAKENSVRVFFLSSPLREDFDNLEWQESQAWLESFPEIEVIGLAPQEVLQKFKKDDLLEGNNLSLSAAKWLSGIWGEQLALALRNEAPGAN